MLGVVGTAIALSAAFFPTFFKGVTSYDDEGSLLVTVRQFLRHGSLYVHTHGGYGPFYFSLAGAIFRLTGQDPTLFTGPPGRARLHRGSSAATLRGRRVARDPQPRVQPAQPKS